MSIFYSDYVTADDYDEKDALAAADWIHSYTQHDKMLPHWEEHPYQIDEDGQDFIFLAEKCFQLARPNIWLNDVLVDADDVFLSFPVYREGSHKLDISRLRARKGDVLRVQGIWGYGDLGPRLGPLAARATIKSAPYLALPTGTYLMVNDRVLLQKVGSTASDIYNIENTGWVSADGLPANDSVITQMLALTSAPFRLVSAPPIIVSVAEGMARFFNIFRNAPATLQEGSPAWEYRTQAKELLDGYKSTLRE